MTAELLARNVAAHWVQVGLVAGSVLAAMRLLKVRAPRLRLATLHAVPAAALLLPLMQGWRQADPAEGALVATIESAAGPQSGAGVAQPPAPGFAAGPFVLGIVFAGIGLRLVWLSSGVLRLLRFRRTAGEIAPPAVASDLEAALGVAPRYFEHNRQGSPVTFGVLRPAVVLPLTFASLDRCTQQVIICHELLHVKRRDAAVALVEEVLAALFWFHPWIWLIRSRIHIEREHIVDALVVGHLGSRDRYIRCLVELSGHDLVPHLSAGMLGAGGLGAPNPPRM
jgi:hypothetical protein